MASAADTGSARRFGAWIRYGDPLTDEQEAFALEHYRVALLQPWETERAARMKAARPDLTLLAYTCLSSTRSYEPGPVYSSGLSFAEADAEEVNADAVTLSPDRFTAMQAGEQFVLTVSSKGFGKRLWVF